MHRSVITLCGSTKFKQYFEFFNLYLTLRYRAAVFSVACFVHADGWEVSDSEKEVLDYVHKKKIVNSDTIFVIDVDGHIGKSTNKEIDFAYIQGKAIKYMSKEYPDYKEMVEHGFATIRWMQQPKNCCGQTCIAMLANCTVQEVIKAIGCSGLTSTANIKSGLKKFGFDPLADRLQRVSDVRKIPENCIVKVCWYSGSGHTERTNQSHWVLRRDGFYYDPSTRSISGRREIKLPDHGKITSFLPFKG